jgi:Putative transposase
LLPVPAAYCWFTNVPLPVSLSAHPVGSSVLFVPLMARVSKFCRYDEIKLMAMRSSPDGAAADDSRAGGLAVLALTRQPLPAARGVPVVFERIVAMPEVDFDTSAIAGSTRSRSSCGVAELRPDLEHAAAARQPLCADIDGFSLHAAVRVEAHDRKRLGQLWRYIARPTPSDEHVQLNDPGQVELELKTPWRDGATQRVMSPRVFMQRLDVQVPQPRLGLPTTEVRRPILALGYPVWVGTAGPDDGGAIGGALHSGWPEACDRTTSYSGRSGERRPHGPMTAWWPSA